jgi:hypothetical protein
MNPSNVETKQNDFPSNPGNCLYMRVKFTIVFTPRKQVPVCENCSNLGFPIQLTIVMESKIGQLRDAFNGMLRFFALTIIYAASPRLTRFLG